MAENENRKNQKWTLVELKKLNEKYHWMIIRRKVYNLKSWTKIHPGGDLIIKHFLYKDATCEFEAYHPEYVKNEILPRYCIGELLESEKTIMDSTLSKNFDKFKNNLEEKKLFEPNYPYYIYEAIRCLSIFFFALWLLLYYAKYNDSYFTYILSGIVLGAFWQQWAFMGHDIGHNQITQKLSIDHIVGILVGNTLGGISIGWWKDSHNVHHVVTNDPENDPDIQHLPFFAVTPKFFSSVFSTYHQRILKFDLMSKIFVKAQYYLYYLIMSLARFNLYAQSLIFLSKNKRARFVILESLGYILFMVWYCLLVLYIPGLGKKFVFVLLSHATSGILHVQITISHFAMSTELRTDDEEFIKHQLRTTMDVECSPWMDWFHGGLQFQCVHHLFPRMPRWNLRRVSYELSKFCDENKLKYYSYDFISGNIHVIKHFKSVSDCI